MRRTILSVLLLMAGIVTLEAPASVDKTEAPKAINMLAWLVGGVWTANASGAAPGMLRIETRYQWADNHAYVRFNTHFVYEKETVRRYDGNFFWDPDRKTLAMWYMNNENEIVEGPVEIQGDIMKMTFRGTNFAGKPADLRVIVSRKNADDYHWELQEKQGESWKSLAGLEYLRTAN
jgi:hypothetical protein